MRNIKFGEVQLNECAKAHIEDCIRTNWLTMGTKVQQFEKEWAKINGVKHCVAVNSGTSACMAALMSLYELGAQPGDNVIVPALSFIATWNSIKASGLRCNFVDVKRESMGIDENLIEGAIDDNTVAIMPVTLMGRPPDMKRIRQIADKHRLKVITDNCEGHGCTFDSQLMEEYSDFTCYSFFSAHIVFAIEKGAVTTNNNSYADILRSVRTHGRRNADKWFDHPIFGLNLKPNDIAAAVGLGSLSDYNSIWSARKKNLNYLRNELSCLQEYFHFVDDDERRCNSPHAFSLIIKDPSCVSFRNLKEYLEHSEIEVKRNFGAPSQHEAFSHSEDARNAKNRYGWAGNGLKEAEYCGENGLHFACHQYLSLEDLDYIIKTVKGFFGDK